MPQYPASLKHVLSFTPVVVPKSHNAKRVRRTKITLTTPLPLILSTPLPTTIEEEVKEALSPETLNLFGSFCIDTSAPTATPSVTPLAPPMTLSDTLLPFLLGRVYRLEEEVKAFQSFNQAILSRLVYLENITSCSSENSPGYTLTPGAQIGYMADMSFTPSPYLPNKENR